MIEVFRYQTTEGHEPVTDWLNSLRDKSLQARLRLRMNRLEAGNFGDCEPVGDGVLERNLTLDEFPAPAELWSRYCAWKGWGDAVTIQMFSAPKRMGLEAKQGGILVPASVFEKRATMSTTGAAAVVPDDYRADQFIGLLRNSMVVRSLGARVLPNLPVIAPCDSIETAAAVEWAAGYEGPVFLRLSRVGVPDLLPADHGHGPPLPWN